MKKITTVLFAVLLVLTGCEYDDSGLNDRLDGLEDRVEQLEKLCEGFNQEIAAMQTMVEALQNNDFITDVEPIRENGTTVGYDVTFSKSGKVTIHCGKDGADGQDGSDGQDGYTPEVGVKQDVDGVYYWTLNGEWILDENGNKIKAAGEDGQDGADGQDGSDGHSGNDGADGAAGKDGVTPQLKIEEGQWYISYDNGAKWILLGTATAPDGQSGADAQSLFTGVEIGEENVIFILKDGTRIEVPLLKDYMKESIRSLKYIPNALDAEFLIDRIGRGLETDTLHFRVAPKSIIPDLIRKYEIAPATLRGTFYETQMDGTEVTGVLESLEMPINHVEGDETTGMLEVVLSGENISEEMKNDFQSERERFMMTLTADYGLNSVESSTIPVQYIFDGPLMTIVPHDASQLETLRQDVQRLLGTAYGPDEVGVPWIDEGLLGVVVGFAPQIDALRPALGSLENVNRILISGISRVEDRAMAGNTSVTEIIFRRLDWIGAEAFMGCTSLHDVSEEETWGLDPEYMGPRAFMESGLESFTSRGERFTEIPEEAFKNCRKMMYISEGQVFTRIGARAFEGTTSINVFNLRNVVEIGEEAFKGSTSYSYVFGDALTTIHRGAFTDIPSRYIELKFGAVRVPQMVDGPVLNNREDQNVIVKISASLEDAFRNDPNWSAVRNLIIIAM